MDRASLWTGQAIPLAFDDLTLGDSAEPTATVPANGQHMVTA